MLSTQVAVYGSSGDCRFIAWTVRTASAGSNLYEVVCFIDDDERNQGKVLDRVPVLSLCEARTRFPEAKVMCGLGSLSDREAVVARAAAAGFGFATVIHPTAAACTEMSTIGIGSMIFQHAVVQPHVTLDSMFVSGRTAWWRTSRLLGITAIS